jgi:hypothetical protein
MPNAFNYDGRTFRTVSNSEAGEVNSQTIFRYHEHANVVWAEYEGGRIVKGVLLATKNPEGVLDMRYQHVNSKGELMTGLCRSVPELLPDGRYRLREFWRWTCGDCSKGESVVEEVG